MVLFFVNSTGESDGIKLLGGRMFLIGSLSRGAGGMGIPNRG